MTPISRTDVVRPWSLVSAVAWAPTIVEPGSRWALVEWTETAHGYRATLETVVGGDAILGVDLLAELSHAGFTHAYLYQVDIGETHRGAYLLQEARRLAGLAGDKGQAAAELIGRLAEATGVGLEKTVDATAFLLDNLPAVIVLVASVVGLAVTK